jgi:hypothetical protein
VTGDRPLWLGLVLYLAVMVAPTLVFWAVLRVPAAIAAHRAGRPESHVAPARPALERLVADLRRLRASLRAAPQCSRVRRVALLSAYDDVLTEVCRAVGVDVSLLGSTPEGAADRAFARLLAEADLEAAGVALDPPGPGREVT